MDSEDGCGIVCGVGERTEFCYDGVCSEFVLGNFPGMMVESCVPLHPPPLQGSDVSALLITFEKGYCRSSWIEYGEGLLGDSDEIPRRTPVRERRPLVPRNCVRSRILPI